MHNIHQSVSIIPLNYLFFHSIQGYKNLVKKSIYNFRQIKIHCEIYRKNI